MANEQITISSTYTKIDNLTLPNDVPFNITCSKALNSGSVLPCKEHINATMIFDNSSRPYFGAFWNSINKKQLSLSESVDGIGHINLYITFSALTRGTLLMQLYDPDYDILDPKFDENDLFSRSLNYDNNYYLSLGFNYELTFTRNVRHSISNKATNYIGIQQTYIDKKFIRSTIQMYLFNYTPTPNAIQVEISSGPFQMEEQVLSILANILAYYGFASALYIVLFGVEKISPWGIVHKGFCCFFRNIKKKTEVEIKKKISDDTDDKTYEVKSEKEDPKMISYLEKCVIDFSLAD
ncbi:22628_t:CDS:2 [Cetraspora pellucida]|uniref:22628_t:CDS:1 n=1 Tax=Cetraspora pellucida TaxID=1433469 RepID=A0A9N9BVI7_9GLOM|nr:22628_t:CDS:2 [Cetraspora pellucida]